MKTLALEHGNNRFLARWQAYSCLLGVVGAVAAWLAAGCSLLDAAQASLLPLVCAQVGLLSGSAASLWSRLGRRIAGSFGSSGSESSTQRRYLEAVAEHHRYIGFPRTSNPHSPVRIEIQAAFVPLRLAPLNNRQGRAASPPQGDPGRAQGSDIWTCLQGAWQHGRNLVILGPPGGGKSTLLQYVALALTIQPKDSDSSANRWMPAFVSLADLLREQVEKPGWSLADAVVEQTRLSDWTPPRHWVKGRLAAGGLVVMLDGLDEQADPQMLRLVQTWVEKQVRSYSATRFVLTATPSGYRQGRLPGSCLFRLQPFGDEQRRLFLRKRQNQAGPLRSKQPWSRRLGSRIRTGRRAVALHRADSAPGPTGGTPTPSRDAHACLRGGVRTAVQPRGVVPAGVRDPLARNA